MTKQPRVPVFRRRQSALASLSLAALCLTGCPNMERQANYRPMEPAPFFPDGTSARPIPAHTVPRDRAVGRRDFLTGRNDDGGLVTQWPVPLSRELLERGRERFTIYCAVCHGADGYGRGIVIRRGFPVPPSFHEERLRREPVGHFFEVITAGYGVMYSYADRVSPADRWAIIAYIRALQRSQNATLADVPPEERATLEQP